MHDGTIRSGRQISRVVAAIVLNTTLLAVIGYSFWHADWQYSLPTPKPEGLVQQPLGSRPVLPPALVSLRRENRALVVNFASAQCPCTEFNLDHVRKLQQQFRNAVDFVTVLETTSDIGRAQTQFQSMHLRMPMLYDKSGEISEALGVYGTPQAAVLDREGLLYYRGNYNQSRYCTEESSEYVRIALSALVNNHAAPAFPKEATITYGCPLPPRFSLRTFAPKQTGSPLP